MKERLAQAVDFLVIGGGPAGCAFAILSARAGASVVLIERDNYKKRRPGEHLAGRVRGAIDALGVSTRDAHVISATSPGILSLWNGRDPLAKPYGAMGQPDALCVSRHRFDELLFRSAQNAGATIFSRATLKHSSRASRGGWNVGIGESTGQLRAVHARSIVDASGRNATFARSQGARRIHRGDLLAIVAWLDAPDAAPRPSAMLTVESCPSGWWSLSVGVDGTLIATLYTSSHIMKSAGVTPKTWWARALAESGRISRTVRQSGAGLSAMGVYSAFPSRLSKISGKDWIAVGDAAVAFDPIGGQGVAYALDTAFRAFEAASVDPSWSELGEDYSDALIDHFDRHLDGRAHVYEEAGAVLSEPFVRYAVMPP